MTNLNVSLQQFGYGFAGLVFAILVVLLLTSFRGRLRGGLLTTAAAVSSAWAVALAWSATGPGLSSLQLFLVELIHDAVWLVFLSALLGGAVGAGRYWIVRYGGIILAGGILAYGVAQELYANYDLQAQGSGETLILGSLLTALYALVAIEQIYRNARESQRRGLKYLCLGIGAIFAYDLFLYSNAILTRQISELFWATRGFVVAMVVPLIAVAAQRSPSWSVGIFVSRQIVFYTATLFGAGIYLTVVGFVGYYLRAVGGDWGQAAQIMFFAAAIIGLFLFLFSDTSRARLRVFISKHFYENKYDYREEWLRLIGTLTAEDEKVPLRKRSMKALTQILDCPAAVLWLQTPGADDYRCIAGWNVQHENTHMDNEASLARFLAHTGWIVDINEYETDSSHYKGLDLERDCLGIAGPAIIVPLIHDAALIGFVVMSQSGSPPQLNYEDRDLLKTAGQQIASYLAQDMATEQLAEGRQFEAFNRLTAYLMHDFKNVIAQQSLVVENAQKHKGNPEFIDDAIATIRGSVARMRRVMDHIQQSPMDQRLERVEMGKLIMQAVSQCADREPVPRMHIGESQVRVRADRERLLMALLHAIRNAQDATAASGDVDVHLESSDRVCTVRIVDTGTGMDEVFIRERLFKPFDSTKGTQGMGIGAYQVRETVQAVGGEMRVESVVDQGTTIIIEIGLASAEKV